MPPNFASITILILSTWSHRDIKSGIKGRECCGWERRVPINDERPSWAIRSAGAGPAFASECLQAVLAQHNFNKFLWAVWEVIQIGPRSFCAHPRSRREPNTQFTILAKTLTNSSIVNLSNQISQFNDRSLNEPSSIQKTSKKQAEKKGNSY